MRRQEHRWAPAKAFSAELNDQEDSSNRSPKAAKSRKSLNRPGEAVDGSKATGGNRLHQVGNAPPVARLAAAAAMR